MNNTAVPQRRINSRNGLGAIVLLTAAALLLGLFAESAPAAQIVGADGRVYACYKAKGKRKGSVRLVAKNARCKRGERKTSWSATGPAGANGQGGTAGSPGSAGGGGAGGGAGVVALESKVLDLTLKLDALEGVLKGVTNGQLLGAIGSLGNVDALCKQATKLTDQVGALGTVIGGLGLNGVLTALGGLLNIPALPAALPAFGCPDAT